MLITYLKTKLYIGAEFNNYKLKVYENILKNA